MTSAKGVGERYDLAIVGAGIVGLAHALVAAKAGLRVVVIERDLRANGASIRNFGFVTVTGQQRGEVWRMARRSRDVWAATAPLAGIRIEHKGLMLMLRRPESGAVAEAFLDTEMGEDCVFVGPTALRERCPELTAPDAVGALFSPHELRVESAAALPALTAWLARVHKVDFRMGEAAIAVDPPLIETSRGALRAERAVVCPGDDFASLFPERLDAYGLQRCRLSMLRLADPGFRWPAGVMSDLGLIRYRGYADLSTAQALRERLAREQPDALAHGVHLIAVAGADGSLVVGDSHHYGDVPAPFAPARTEALILEEFRAATGLEPPPVLERWTGTYATSQDRPFLIDAPSTAVRLVMVTTGAGASIAFALAEKTMAEFGVEARA